MEQKMEEKKLKTYSEFVIGNGALTELQKSDLETDLSLILGTTGLENNPCHPDSE